MGEPVFKLQIVHADTGMLAVFAGKGIVECDLVEAVSRAMLRTMVPAVLEAVQARGRWWVRPDHFDSAVESALRESVPKLAAEAVDAVILAVKQDASVHM